MFQKINFILHTPRTQSFGVLIEIFLGLAIVAGIIWIMMEIIDWVIKPKN
ncbi:MAG: hypothetical protein HYV52_03155 [Parcubacteria group bacterium]|nr:hypothetical protein [Parcubacteria group bacterium]